jgi:hypothetical protein
MLSQQFIIALKLSDEPAYRIAQKAGLDPTLLSKIIRGIVKVKQNDQRVLAVAQILGINPEDCFEKTVSQ